MRSQESTKINHSIRTKYNFALHVIWFVTFWPNKIISYGSGGFPLPLNHCINWEAKVNSVKSFFVFLHLWTDILSTEKEKKNYCAHGINCKTKIDGHCCNYTRIILEPDVCLVFLTWDLSYFKGHLSFRSILNYECFYFNLLKFSKYLLKFYIVLSTDR